MDALLVKETAFAIFSDPLKMEGYSSNDIAVMWAAKLTFGKKLRKPMRTPRGPYSELKN